MIIVPIEIKKLNPKSDGIKDNEKSSDSQSNSKSESETDDQD